MKSRIINRCRLCGNSDLADIMDLGNMKLTGSFPANRDEKIDESPLHLVKCNNKVPDDCGLLQLRHSYYFSKEYWANYGYRSSLNNSMTVHLQSKITKILSKHDFPKNSCVLDIGSNDATLLNSYPDKYILIGVDPAGDHFEHCYSEKIEYIKDYFGSDQFNRSLGSRKMKIVTSVAVFYDIEDPAAFISKVHSLLDEDGIFHMELSYMPDMIISNTYDNICHEHLAYYGLEQLKWIADRTGFKIIDIELNHTNGSSIAITFAKHGSAYEAAEIKTEALIREEKLRCMDSIDPYLHFREKVFSHRDELNRLIIKLNEEGSRITAYGASTKGNVLLQFCGITDSLIDSVLEVNSDKFGCYTPGSSLRIIDEKKLEELKPDYLLVLPWHFRSAIIEKEQEYLRNGGKLIFPFPSIEIIEY